MKPLVRRGFKIALLGAGALIAVLILAACGDGEEEARAPATVKLALDWFPNTNHTGFYVADQKGFYEDAGIKLEILPYSGTAADTLAGSGQANCAISFHDFLTFSRSSGLPLKGVMAILQHAVLQVVVRADRDDIQSPKDLDGKKYGGFGLPYEEPLVRTIIQNAGGKGEFENVTLQTAAYEAVYGGQVDFSIWFATWEAIENQLRNRPAKTWDLTDYGLPDFYSTILVCNENWLQANGDVAKAFIQASKKGWEFAAENPREAAQILIDANPGTFTEPELVFRSAELQAEKYLLDENGEFGKFTLEKWTPYARFLFEEGILTDAEGNPITEEPDWSEYFTNEFL